MTIDFRLILAFPVFVLRLRRACAIFCFRFVPRGEAFVYRVVSCLRDLFQQLFLRHSSCLDLNCFGWGRWAM
jgi:hypothetical protein